ALYETSVPLKPGVVLAATVPPDDSGDDSSLNGADQKTTSPNKTATSGTQGPPSDSSDSPKKQLRTPTTTATQKNKTPPARVLRFSISNMPGLDGIPLVSKIAAPVDEIDIVWANRDLTADEAALLCNEAFPSDRPLLFNQSSESDGTIAIAAGCHFQIAETLNGQPQLVLDHVVGAAKKPKRPLSSKKSTSSDDDPTSPSASKSSPVSGEDAAKTSESSTKGSEPSTAETETSAKSTTTKVPSDSNATKEPSEGSATTGKPTNTTVAPLAKKVGPLSISNVSLQADGNFQSISMVFTAMLTLGPVQVSLIDFSLSLDLTTIKTPQDLLSPKLSLSLDGLGLAIDKPPTFNLQGAIMRLADTTTGTTEWAGGLEVEFEKWGASAMGMYEKTKAYEDIFAFGQIRGLIAELGWAEVNGLTAGFGYNTFLALPVVTDVSSWPLIALNQQGAAPQGTLALQLASLIGTKSTKSYISPRDGSRWLAAGVSMLAFKVVDIDAVLSVDLTGSGNKDDVIIDITAEATTSFPRSSSSGDTFVLVDMGATATLDTNVGYLFSTAQLTPRSFILSSDCHLTGGMIYATWVAPNQYEGDFVLSIGGFHPLYTPPSWYPAAPPRVGISWNYDSDLSILGQAYFAITPGALMGGARLDMSFDIGWLWAAFTIWTDFFVQFHPFWFDVSVGFNFSCGVSIGSGFLSIHLGPLEFGANMELWGPAMAGTATLHFWWMSHTFSFGDDGESPAKLDIDEFLTLVRNQNGGSDSSSEGNQGPGDSNPTDILIAIKAGIVNSPQTTKPSTTVSKSDKTSSDVSTMTNSKQDSSPAIVTTISGASSPPTSVRGSQLEILVQIRFPALTVKLNDTTASTPGSSEGLYAAPMQLTKSFQESELSIKLTSSNADSGSEGIQLTGTPVIKNVAPNIWGTCRLSTITLIGKDWTNAGDNLDTSDLGSQANASPISHIMGYSVKIVPPEKVSDGMPIVNYTTYQLDEVSSATKSGSTPSLAPLSWSKVDNVSAIDVGDSDEIAARNLLIKQVEGLWASLYPVS
ncbi:hypothetical protein IL306_012852, partial [Fusarium sp. DS 682]